MQVQVRFFLACFFSFTLLSIGSVSAQETGVLSGEVLDVSNSEPLAGLIFIGKMMSQLE
jgi:hypothetical protein